jgi:hypothetical protein
MTTLPALLLLLLLLMRLPRKVSETLIGMSSCRSVQGRAKGMETNWAERKFHEACVSRVPWLTLLAGSGSV